MIYLDDSSTTKLDERVYNAMIPYMLEYYGNASSTHSFGQKSKFAIDEARYAIAKYINSSPQEIVFTSTGSESITLALKGTAEYLSGINNTFEPEHVYLVTTPMEHNAVINTISYLSILGYKNKIVDINEFGQAIIIKNNEFPNSLEQILTDIKQQDKNAHIIVSIQYVNSETGAIQNIKEVSQISHSFDAIVHTDAMQASKLLNISINELEVDLMTFAAHKIYGPVGAACLYIKSGSKISRQIAGGEQEYKIRAGTQNTPAIVGFGKAIELLAEERESRVKLITELSENFISNLKKKISNISILAEFNKIPSIVSVVFPQVNAVEFLVRLDLAGIMASAGSACNSGSIQPTANLKHMGLNDNQINSVIRFSIGKDIKNKDIDEACKIISEEYKHYIRSRKN